MFVKSELLQRVIYSKTNQTRDEFIREFGNNDIVQSIPSTDRRYFLNQVYSLIHNFNIHSNSAKLEAIKRFNTDYYQAFNNDLSQGLQQLNSNRQRTFYIEALLNYDTVDEVEKSNFLLSVYSELTGIVKSKVDNYFRAAVNNDNIDIIDTIKESGIEELARRFNLKSNDLTNDSLDEDLIDDDLDDLIDDDDDDIIEEGRYDSLTAEDLQRITSKLNLSPSTDYDQILSNLQSDFYVHPQIFRSVNNHIINTKLNQLVEQHNNLNIRQRIIDRLTQSINSPNDLPAFLTKTKDNYGNLVLNRDLVQTTDPEQLRAKVEITLKSRFPSAQSLIKKVLLTGEDKLDKLEELESLDNFPAMLDGIIDYQINELKQSKPNELQRSQLKQIKRKINEVDEEYLSQHQLDLAKKYDKLPQSTTIDSADFYSDVLDSDVTSIDRLINRFNLSSKVSPQIQRVFDMLRSIRPGEDINEYDILNNEDIIQAVRQIPGIPNVTEFARQLKQFRQSPLSFRNWWQELIEYVKQNRGMKKDQLYREVESRAREKIKRWNRGSGDSKQYLTDLEDIKRISAYIMDFGIGSTVWRGEQRDSGFSRGPYNVTKLPRSRENIVKVNRGELSQQDLRKKSKPRIDKGTHDKRNMKKRPRSQHNLELVERGILDESQLRDSRSDSGTSGQRDYKPNRKPRK